MYRHSGRTVCVMAIIVGVIGILGIVFGMIIGFYDSDLAFLGIALAFGGIGIVISSFPLYAFGQMAEYIGEIKEILSQWDDSMNN